MHHVTDYCRNVIQERIDLKPLQDSLKAQREKASRLQEQLLPLLQHETQRWSLGEGKGHVRRRTRRSVIQPTRTMLEGSIATCAIGRGSPLEWQDAEIASYIADVAKTIQKARTRVSSYAEYIAPKPNARTAKAPSHAGERPRPGPEALRIARLFGEAKREQTRAARRIKERRKRCREAISAHEAAILGRLRTGAGSIPIRVHDDRSSSARKWRISRRVVNRKPRITKAWVENELQESVLSMRARCNGAPTGRCLRWLVEDMERRIRERSGKTFESLMLRCVR